MAEGDALPRPMALAWCGFQPRTRALAEALGGTAQFISDRGEGGRFALPFRYLRAALTTWKRLSRDRPRLVVAISPPFLCPLVAWIWSRAHGARLVIDCHTGAFHGPRWSWARPISRWLAHRADLVTLHTESHRDEVEGWGARAILLPDDVPGPDQAEALTNSPAAPRPPVVVIAGSLDGNEPVAEALEAARLLPEVEVRMTGNADRLPRQLIDGVAPNVVFTGWLDYRRFLGELLAADVVAAFSMDPHIMNRAAFEAVGMGRALVLSDVPGLRSRFGDAAIFCENEPDGMANALRSALNRRQALELQSASLQATLQAQREEGLHVLCLLTASPTPKAARCRLLMVSQHPFPENPTLRRNVNHLLARGWQLDLVCTAWPGFSKPPTQPGLRVWALGIPHRRSRAAWYPVEYIAFFFRALPRVTWLSLRHRYRTVQVDNVPDFLVFCVFVARLRNARIVLFLYELMPEMTMSRLQAGARHPLVRLTRWLERRATSWADRIVSVTAPIRRILVERGVDPDKVVVVPNVQPAVGGERTRSASNPTAPSLITHATLLERYGVHVAIRAMIELRQRWPTLTLSVLGDGEYRPRLEQLAAELGLEDVVEFTGFLPWELAVQRIRASTVGIVPVLADGYGELLLPNKLFDYVAEGVPAICSRLPTIEEYFPKGSVAYFEPGDAPGLARQAERLLADPELRRHQVHAAQLAANAVSWNKVSKDYSTALGEGV